MSRTLPIRSGKVTRDILKRELIDVCGIFMGDKPPFSGVYTVRTLVTDEEFELFCQALEGYEIEVTPDNFMALKDLSDEFGYHCLDEKFAGVEQLIEREKVRASVSVDVNGMQSTIEAHERSLCDLSGALRELVAEVSDVKKTARNDTFYETLTRVLNSLYDVKKNIEAEVKEREKSAKRAEKKSQDALAKEREMWETALAKEREMWEKALENEKEERARDMVVMCNRIAMCGVSGTTTSPISQDDAMKYNGEMTGGVFAYFRERYEGNVHDKGVVEVTASGTATVGVKREPRMTVDSGWKSWWASRNLYGSWIRFDFKKRVICPTHYVLRINLGTSRGFMQEWKVSGSMDGQEWKDLDQRSTDVLKDKQLHLFKCQLSNGFFRFLQVQQTAINGHDKNHHMYLSEIEFFGSVNDGAKTE